MAQRAILTEDGCLLLERPGDGPGDDPIYTNGDIITTWLVLTNDRVKFEFIEDVDARPEFAGRVARLRRTL